MVVLAVCLALSWSVVQLLAAVSAVTFAGLTGKTSLGGLAPAISMIGWAGASLAMGRFMDVRGRAVGLRAGFGIGVAGAGIVYVGVTMTSAPLFLAGLACVGMCGGTINLARAGAADMYPPERRARGISYVLLGAAFGAILSPIVFAPMLAEARSATETPATPWLVAAVLLGLGVVVTFGIRVDPMQIARRMAAGPLDGGPREPPRPLRQIVRSPAVVPAMASAIVSQAVMAAFMSVVGLIMVENGHDLRVVALSMGAHFVGMFGLVLVAGQLVDWLGRQRSIIIGLLVLTGGVLTLAVSPSLWAMMPAMFTIGLGWNIAFVGSTAVLADAASPAERARLLGFNDFVATSASAVSAVVVGLAFGLAGLAPLVVIATVVSLSPIAFLIAARRVAVPTQP